MPRRRPEPGTWERTNLHSRGVARGAGAYTEDDFVTPTVEHPANVVTSLCSDGLHRPVLDIDFPCVLKKSTTPGHFHLFLNGPGLEWDRYVMLLGALEDAGLVESGYVQASIRQGMTCARLPGVERPPRPEPIEAPPIIPVGTATVIVSRHGEPERRAQVDVWPVIPDGTPGQGLRVRAGNHHAGTARRWEWIVTDVTADGFVALDLDDLTGPITPEPPSQRLEPSYWQSFQNLRDATAAAAITARADHGLAPTEVVPTVNGDPWQPLTLEQLTDVARRYRDDHGFQSNPPLVVTPDQYEALRRDLRDRHQGSDPHGIGYVQDEYPRRIFGLPIEVRENGRLMRRVVDTERVESADGTHFTIPTTVHYEPRGGTR